MAARNRHPAFDRQIVLRSSIPFDVSHVRISAQIRRLNRQVDVTRASIASLAAAVAILLASPCPRVRAAQNKFAAQAQPVGAPLSTIIEFGDDYNGGDELYDAKITVLEIVRGEKALDLVRHAGASNPVPKSGFDYVLARIRFQFSARAVPENHDYTLNPSQFAAMSADGVTYPAPVLAAPVQPALHATLRSGQSAEGWIVLQVPHADCSPLMLFTADVGSTFHEGGGSLFRLYETPPATNHK